MRPGRWTVTGRGQAAFPVPVASVRGNNLPGFTGAVDRPSLGAPGPYTGGNVGGTDLGGGADPRADHMQPSRTFSSRTGRSAGGRGRRRITRITAPAGSTTS